MYHRNPIPPKEGGCHRTGFTKTCFECVTEHKCKLWKRVALILDRHPETGAEIPSDAYDCIDSITELFYKDMLRRQLQTTHTVDKLSAEVKAANDTGMANALMGINRQVRRLADQQQQDIAQIAVEPQKLIGNGSGE